MSHTLTNAGKHDTSKIAFAMFDVTSFPAILSGIERHFKFNQYVHYNVSSKN